MFSLCSSFCHCYGLLAVSIHILSVSTHLRLPLVFVGIDTILIVLPHSDTEVIDTGYSTRSSTRLSEVPHVAQPRTQPPWFCVDSELVVQPRVVSLDVVGDP